MDLSRQRWPGQTGTGIAAATRALVMRARSALLQVALGISLLALTAWSVVGSAQSSASYEVTRHSIDAGGDQTSSADYTMQGSIGQPDAGRAMTSSNYTLRGGFQRSQNSVHGPVFADGFE